MARNGGDERRREEASTSASTVLQERVPAPASVEGLGPTVVDFMNKRSMLAEDGDTEALATLERNFVTAADPDTLLALIRAANLFGTGNLMDVIAQRLINLMKEKKDDEIRQMFHIENDLILGEKSLLQLAHVPEMETYRADLHDP
uniref:SKP1 component dimerisation domain-containing protein n=1 Tax=Ananas comosus var. bracteatus TaxID=296719 RepID=A0A6V7PY23_ANACO|nr:unnamed protein product [Ananas comosus var. bracteatus]